MVSMKVPDFEALILAPPPLNRIRAEYNVVCRHIHYGMILPYMP